MHGAHDVAHNACYDVGRDGRDRTHGSTGGGIVDGEGQMRSRLRDFVLVASGVVGGVLGTHFLPSLVGSHAAIENHVASDMVESTAEEGNAAGNVAPSVAETEHVVTDPITVRFTCVMPGGGIAGAPPCFAGGYGETDGEIRMTDEAGTKSISPYDFPATTEQYLTFPLSAEFEVIARMASRTEGLKLRVEILQGDSVVYSSEASGPLGSIRIANDQVTWEDRS